jgi:hypothetical protein
VRAIRLILINLLLFAGLWGAALVLVSLGQDVDRLVKAVTPESPDPRALLPNYPDRTQAMQIYGNCSTGIADGGRRECL